MPKTIDSLVNDCNMDTLPSMPVIADYYGLQNFNEDNIPVILGIYQKMLNLNLSVLELIKMILKKLF